MEELLLLVFAFFRKFAEYAEVMECEDYDRRFVDLIWKLIMLDN